MGSTSCELANPNDVIPSGGAGTLAYLSRPGLSKPFAFKANSFERGFGGYYRAGSQPLDLFQCVNLRASPEAGIERAFGPQDLVDTLL